MPKFTGIDLFAGIGGFHQAFHNSDVEVVFAAENDEYARATYAANFLDLSPLTFQDGNFAGDINKVNPMDIPNFNILAAGFPCQPFSKAGKQEGFADTRGTLFFNIASILTLKRPEAVFLENVKGLMTHDNGNTFNTIKNVLTGLGYKLHYQVVKASEHNLPQHRPRLFIIGFRQDVDDSTFEFPEAVPLTNTISEVLGGEVTYLNGNPRTVGYTLRVGGRGSGIHDRHNWDAYLVDGEEHRLTVNDARKMQGFPEGFVFPVSNTQAFKQLGNSVAVNAITATMQRVTSALAHHQKEQGSHD